MLNIYQTRENPFAYRVTGTPGPTDKKVDVTFTRSVHRHAAGAILGPNTVFATGDGTGVFRQEARWLADHAVITESY